MPKFLITLQPLTPFFFGGEKTFGNDNADYFVESNYLPQQTTLLGFLRHQLLIKANLIGTTIDENWNNLIGPNSFQENGEGKFTIGFGRINKLSPVFLVDNNKSYLPQSLDWAHFAQGKGKSKNIAPINYSIQNGQWFTKGEPKSVPKLMVNGEPYNPKYGLADVWLDDEGKLYKTDYDDSFEESKEESKKEKGKRIENGLFVAKEQVGIFIPRDKNGRVKRDTGSKEGNFYRQKFYTFHKKEMKFAFIADLSEANLLQSNVVVEMGGERSTFKMEVQEVKETIKDFDERFKNIFSKNNEIRPQNSIILTSDAYCNFQILEHCDFAITQSIPFRCLRTPQEEVIDTDEINYSDLEILKSEKKEKTKSEKKKITKSERYNLLKRGSVLYVSEDKLKEVKEALKNEAFKNIGYNQYIIIENQSS